jgi:hypothetical protein
LRNAFIASKPGSPIFFTYNASPPKPPAMTQTMPQLIPPLPLLTSPPPKPKLDVFSNLWMSLS